MLFNPLTHLKLWDAMVLFLIYWKIVLWLCTNFFTICSPWACPNIIERLVHLIKPIFKLGDKTCIRNYRPISLLLLVCKVLEKPFHNSIVDFITSSIFLNQFDILWGHSTLQQLLIFFNYLFCSREPSWRESKLHNFWGDHFVSSFASNNECTYHYLCPCYKCSKLPVHMYFNSSLFYVLLLFFCFVYVWLLASMAFRPSTPFHSVLLSSF